MAPGRQQTQPRSLFPPLCVPGPAAAHGLGPSVPLVCAASTPVTRARARRKGAVGTGMFHVDPRAKSGPGLCALPAPQGAEGKCSQSRFLHHCLSTGTSFCLRRPRAGNGDGVSEKLPVCLTPLHRTGRGNWSGAQALSSLPGIPSGTGLPRRFRETNLAHSFTHIF